MSNYKRETLIRVNLISVSLSLLLYVTGWLIAACAGFFARMFKRKIIVASIGFVFLFVKNMLDTPRIF
ncbi:MAG: hypothetical protein LBG74_03425 [Spirochaetaceae bacterium]|jgi:hypothetical protein|nr:hypothetical protein [Spirochaetaceae bacterium]